MRRLIFISFLVLVAACTIQKRTVNKGYFVQWHWQKKTSNSPVKPEAGSTEDLDVVQTKEEEQGFEANPINYGEIAAAETNPAFQTESFFIENKDQEKVKPQDLASHMEETPKISKEETKSAAKALPRKKTNILDDFAILYVIVAGVLLLLSLIFLLIGFNAANVGTLFFVLSICCFAGAIVVLAFALLLFLFSHRIRKSLKK